LDELDIRIFRALLTDKLSAPFSTHVRASLRQVARDVKADDVTVRNRFKRFQERGFLSGWRLLPNPSLFGYGYSVLLVDIPPKSSKDDLVERLKPVPGVVVILEYYGDSLGVNLFHDSEQSLARAIESISRITKAEGIIRFRVFFPPPQGNHLTDTDWAIIENMRGDAWKSHVQVAKELKFTARTVKNRLERLQAKHALVVPPAVDIASLDRTIGVVLFYSYSGKEKKSVVDSALLARFDGSYLWARMTDPERAYLILVAPTMASVKAYLDWARQQPGVASARAEIVVESLNLWDNVKGFFRRENLLPAS
jgi:DNA-binding Lrp family transcriptional regulator